MFFGVVGHIVALIYSVMTVLMTVVHIRTLAAPVSMLTTLQMYLQSEPVETPLVQGAQNAALLSGIACQPYSTAVDQKEGNDERSSSFGLWVKRVQKNH